MPKITKYGAAKTRQEKREAYFRRQIDTLKALMGVKNLTAIEDALGFGHNKLRRLYRGETKLKIEDADRIDKLFGKYGARLGLEPDEGGNLNAG